VKEFVDKGDRPCSRVAHRPPIWILQLDLVSLRAFCEVRPSKFGEQLVTVVLSGFAPAYCHSGSPREEQLLVRSGAAACPGSNDRFKMSSSHDRGWPNVRRFKPLLRSSDMPEVIPVPDSAVFLSIATQCDLCCQFYTIILCF